MPNRLDPISESSEAAANATSTSLQTGVLVSASSLRTLLEAVGDSLWDWNLLTNEAFFSRSYKQILGYAEHELGNHINEWIDRLHPDDAQEAMRATRLYLEGEIPQYEHEHRLRCRDGNWKWLRSRGTLVERTIDGQPARMIGLVSDITENHRLTDQLKQSHTLLSNFSQQLPGMFYQYQRFPDGRSCYPYVSDAVTAIYGVTAEQIRYDASLVLAKIHPDDLVAIREAGYISATMLTPWHQEYRVIGVYEEERWYVGDATPEKLSDGSILWHGYLNDITERKHAEQRAQNAELQIRLILEAANQGLYDVNVQTGETKFSVEYARMLGYEPEEYAEFQQLWGNFAQVGVHPEDIQALKQALRNHLRAPEQIDAQGKSILLTDYHAEFRQRTKSGEWKWIMSRGRVVERDKQGHALRMQGTHIDITEQKVSEETLRINQELLQASKDRYKLLARELDILINNAPVGIMFVSDGVIILANQALAELCNFPDAQAMIGVKTSFLYCGEDDYQAFGQRVIPQLIADERVELEWTVKRITGETFLARIAGRALPEENYVRGAVWMLEDISERHRINKLKSEFISVVSHELRTPLTSIRGSLGLLDAGVAGVLPAKAAQLIKIAHSNSCRLIGLVNDILDMDKLVSGKMRFKEEFVDLLALINSAIEANAAYALSLKVSLQFSTDVSSAWILADHDRLMQIMANLLSNAAKFSPEGEAVQIRLLHQSLADVGGDSGHSYRIEVSDHGPGIPKAFQAHLFEPFTQADGTDTRQQGGTGLGLPITKTLVEKMHGRLGFTTTEGKGSSFWVEFKAVSVPESAAI